MAQHIFQHHSNHIYDEAGKFQTVDTLINGEQKDLWNQIMSNELGRLAQGNDAGVKSNDCIDFIHNWDVPNYRKATYENFVSDYWTLKSDKYRIRLVVGGEKLDYALKDGSPADYMLETKLLVNIVISDAKEVYRFMRCDIKDFFLCTTMDTSECIWIPYKYFPEDIRKQYNPKE